MYGDITNIALLRDVFPSLVSSVSVPVTAFNNPLKCLFVSEHDVNLLVTAIDNTGRPLFVENQCVGRECGF